MVKIANLHGFQDCATGRPPKSWKVRADAPEGARLLGPASLSSSQNRDGTWDFTRSTGQTKRNFDLECERAAIIKCSQSGRNFQTMKRVNFLWINIRVSRISFGKLGIFVCDATGLSLNILIAMHLR